MLGHHIIWGKVEEPMSEDSCSASNRDAHSAEFSADAGKPRARSAGLYPAVLQNYLEGVTFTNESSGSADHSIGSSSGPSPKPSRVVPQAARTGGAMLLSSAPKRTGALTVGLTNAAASALATEYHPADAEASAPNGEASSLVKVVVDILEDADQRVLVETLLGFDGPGIAALAEFWSEGSRIHAEGCCKPCHYVHIGEGCVKGASCEFCHLPHLRKNKARPCKTKRQHCKRFVTALANIADVQPGRFRAGMEAAGANNPQVRELLLACDASNTQGSSPSATCSPSRRKVVLSL